MTNITSRLEQAVAAHLAGDLRAPALVYEQTLQDDPLNPLALHYYGIWLHQMGYQEEAIKNLVLSCALASENPDWHNDLGNVLFAAGAFEDAEQAYREALDIAPRDHAVWNNLGAAQRQQEKTEEAIASFKQVLALVPDFVPALLHLGSLFEAAGDKHQASLYQCQAYVLPPLEGKSKEILAISFYFLGRIDDAAAAYEAWLAEEPGHPAAIHLLAACSQNDIPARASDQYLEFHFNRYADTFDANLVESLGYRGPRMIQEGLDLIARPEKQFDTLDIGCGTGLCGPVLAPYSRSITGVDLADKMLKKAEASGHYSYLEKSEIGHFLANSSGTFDLVAAADTLIYFGDLLPLFQRVASALRDGGYFVFTIEAMLPEGPSPTGFCLHASGRYRHGLGHVSAVLEQCGLGFLHMSHGVLRHEASLPVNGMLVVAQKRAH